MSVGVVINERLNVLVVINEMTSLRQNSRKTILLVLGGHFEELICRWVGSGRQAFACEGIEGLASKSVTGLTLVPIWYPKNKGLSTDSAKPLI